MGSEAELWAFLCSLRHEFSPVILRSKDVYGYASCRALVPDLPPGAAAGPGAARRRAAAARGKRPRADGAREGGASPAAKDLTPAAPQLSARPAPPPQGTLLDGGSREGSRKAALPPLASRPPIRVRGNIWNGRSLDATRRRAQRILRVNLAPVVRLCRMPGLPC